MENILTYSQESNCGYFLLAKQYRSIKNTKKAEYYESFVKKES